MISKISSFRIELSVGRLQHKGCQVPKYCVDFIQKSGFLFQIHMHVEGRLAPCITNVWSLFNLETEKDYENIEHEWLALELKYFNRNIMPHTYLKSINEIFSNDWIPKSQEQSSFFLIYFRHDVLVSWLPHPMITFKFNTDWPVNNN